MFWRRKSKKQITLYSRYKIGANCHEGQAVRYKIWYRTLGEYRLHVIYWKQKHEDSQGKTRQDMTAYKSMKSQSDEGTGSDKDRMDHQRKVQWHAQQRDSQDAEDLCVLGSETVEEIQRHDRASSTHEQTQGMHVRTTGTLQYYLFVTIQVPLQLRQCRLVLIQIRSSTISTLTIFFR